MEKITEIPIPTGKSVYQRLLKFASQFEHAQILYSNNYPDPYGRYHILAGFGGYRLFESNSNSFEELKKLHLQKPSWLFGHLNYELKNQVEKLQTKNEKQFSFADMAFFEPAYLIMQRRGEANLSLFVNFEVDEKPIQDWVDSLNEYTEDEQNDFPELQARISKEEYLNSVEELKKQIQYGNIYEVNYCQEFFARDISLNPYQTASHLNQVSPMPFGCFYNWKSNYLMGASPERFLCKRDDRIYAQPIKGTYPRGNSNKEDEALKEQLRNDLKEQTENVMIVDLMRNDLSKVAAKSSVKVEELFGTYTFPQVHQLISTISCKLKPNFHSVDSLKNAFPMGSMTGAPKVSAMKLIDDLEYSARELYSGSVGYIEPSGDFDFNVVIRSLLYQKEKKYLSLTVGGAITNQSEAEKEYQECLLKAKAIFDIQNQTV